MLAVSYDALNDFDVRTREILAANLAAAGRDAELDVWPDTGTYRNGAGEDILDEYQDAAQEAIEQIEAETCSAQSYGKEGARASYWQSKDGWYWTIISPDGINYDDDHGPYEDKGTVLDAIAVAQERDND